MRIHTVPRFGPCRYATVAVAGPYRERGWTGVSAVTDARVAACLEMKVSMNQRLRRVAGSAAVALAALACIAGTVSAQGGVAVRDNYTRADVDFVQGMIEHHSQAVVMSDWCATHGALSNLAILCRRIALSQKDEITMMQHWLEERHLAVPDPLHMLPADSGARASGTHAAAAHDMASMDMPGRDMSDHAMMPGMLTPAQMKQLEAARGAEFDRLYLTGMIRHHQGALDMVAKLFDTPGSGQQPEVFNFATDVDASQRVEIARMQAMLNTLNSSQTR